MENTLLNIKDILEKYRDEFTEEEKRQTEDFDLVVEALMKRRGGLNPPIKIKVKKGDDIYELL